MRALFETLLCLATFANLASASSATLASRVYKDATKPSEHIAPKVLILNAV